MSLEDRILLVTNADIHEIADVFLRSIPDSESLVGRREVATSVNERVGIHCEYRRFPPRETVKSFV
jgi:hypothetical protein